MPDFEDSQFEFEFSDNHQPANLSDPTSTCSQGHRSSLVLGTTEGGSICLLCFSNLILDPKSPTFHVSYALSQLSHALSQPPFLQSLLSFHLHIVVSPLVQSLSFFDDVKIARQLVDLIIQLSDAGDSSVLGEFVARISTRLCMTDALTWSRRQAYTIHCLGVLLNHQSHDPYEHIKNRERLIDNLITGLQLPSEETRGEILFVLYRISILQCARMVDEDVDILHSYGFKLLRSTMEVLLKSQSDEVHLNSIALLKVFAQRGILANGFLNENTAMSTSEDENSMQLTDEEVDNCSLEALFAEAIKTPLLSPDSQVQIATLDLMFDCLSREGFSVNFIQVLVEGNVMDYVFEILRLSDIKYDLINSCLRVLNLLSTAEHVFNQRLAIGFATLVSTLVHVADVPSHPLQREMLKLIFLGIRSCPGVVSSKHIEYIGGSLTEMLRKQVNGEMGMPPEAFSIACSTFVSLMKSPSSDGALNLATLVQQSSRYAVLASLSIYDKDPRQILPSLYLLKEAYELDQKLKSNDNSTDLKRCTIELCQQNIVPWFVNAIYDMEEEGILGVLETFHVMILESSDARVLEFTKILVSFSWFHLLFQCLGLYPTERMKLRVYLMLCSFADNLFGFGYGGSIKETATSLPIDPVDLLFLLGQKTNHNQELSSRQSAVLRILYVCSSYNEMFAEDKLVLTSLEQYILVNSSYLLCSSTDSVTQLVCLYGHYRDVAHMAGRVSHSLEAEKIFFKLVNEVDWELSFGKSHPKSLKWLFQQDIIGDKLSLQILNFCRNSIPVHLGTAFYENDSQTCLKDVIAELVVAGDNYASELLVFLLNKLIETENAADDVVLMLNLITSIIYINANASDQLCMHGVGTAIRSLFYSSIYSSREISKSVSHCMFVILSSAQPQVLVDDEAWLAVTMKLLVSFNSDISARDWSNDHVISIGILSLILHHSTHKALITTSQSILSNSSLPSMIQNTFEKNFMSSCQIDNNEEGKDAVTPLVFMLLLSCFYLKSLQQIIPDYEAHGQTSLPDMGILCQGYCRVMYHGSPLLKIISSYCLVELLTGISASINRNQTKVKLESIIGNSRSVIAVLEGLVFHDDSRVAVNAGKCLAILLSWRTPWPEKVASTTDKWLRMIVEELAVSLGAPCSVSKSFPKHHRAAIHVAIALLRLNNVPGWMRSVFDEQCVTAIIQNLSPCNLSVELVKFFQGLLRLSFLKADHIASLNYAFQASRKKHEYEDYRQVEQTREQRRKVIVTTGNIEEVCEFLLCLVNDKSNDIHNGSSLNEELEVFFQCVAECKLA